METHKVTRIVFFEPYVHLEEAEIDEETLKNALLESRDWRKEGCATTCEYVSWCGSNDKQRPLEKQYNRSEKSENFKK